MISTILNDKKNLKCNFQFDDPLSPDMCRTETKGAVAGKIQDRNFEIALEFEKKGLAERVVSIYAAQLGVAASGGDSLIQRIQQELKRKNQKSLKLKDFRKFNSEARTQKVVITWPTGSHSLDFHEMNFPMGGELELEVMSMNKNN